MSALSLDNLKLLIESLSLDEFKLIAKSRGIKAYKSLKIDTERLKKIREDLNKQEINFLNQK